MKVQSSKVAQAPRPRIPAQQGREPSSREIFSGGRGSSQSDCHGFIAIVRALIRELRRDGSVVRVETGAGP